MKIVSVDLNLLQAEFAECLQANTFKKGFQ